MAQYNSSFDSQPFRPSTSPAAIRDSNNQIQPPENVNTTNKQTEISGPSTSQAAIRDSNTQTQPPESVNNKQPEPREKSVRQKLRQTNRGKQRRQRHKEIRKLFSTIKQCGLSSNFGLSSFQNKNRLSNTHTRPKFQQKSKSPEKRPRFQNKSKTSRQTIVKGTQPEPEIAEEIRKEQEMAEETIFRKLQKIIDGTDNQVPMEDDCIIIEQKPEIINLDDTAEDLNQPVVTNDNIKNEQIDQTTSNSLKRSASLASLEEGEIDDSPVKKTEKRNLADSFPVIYQEDLTIVVHQNPVKNKKNLPSKHQPLREVVVINDASPSTSKGVKAENSSENDDSVLFVGEEIDVESFKPQMNFDTMGKAPDFISLAAYGYSPPKQPKEAKQNIRNVSTRGILRSLAKLQKTGRSNVTQLPSHTAISSLEKMISTVYNSNISNPNRGKVATGKRMVLVDGSNIAMFKSSGREYSIDSIEQCVRHFTKLGHKCKAIVPNYRQHNNTNKEKLKEMFNANLIVYTPSKNLPGMKVAPYDDRFLLQLADELDAAVISNDNYRDLFNESPSFQQIIQTRVIGFTFSDDIFIVPKDPYGKNGPTLDQILNVS